MKKTFITVVFSSHISKQENQDFINHINQTIGLKPNKFEVICYENFNQFSLTELYNKALNENKRKDNIFVFLHNDIIIKTPMWGRLALSKINNTGYGVVGVAGTTFMNSDGVWWTDKSKMYGIVEHTNGVDTWVSEYSKEKKGYITPVVVVDGLFFIVNPDNIEHGFDQDFKGFHYYDISFCFENYIDGVDIGVTTDIRVLHKSIGQTNTQWEKNKELFIGKYGDELPCSIPPKFNDFNIRLTEKPKVSVIIPTKNNIKYVYDNICSWKDVVEYDNYEIIIADTGSEPDVIQQYQNILDHNIRLVRYNYYNFGKINNDVVNNHVSDDTDIILFCNDDIVLLNDCLSRCVEIYNQNKDVVGTIGIRLHYGDGSVQHNGITIKTENNNLKISHKDLKKVEGYTTDVDYNSIGNTGGFLLINKLLYDSIGGFNENYIECFEDVELNLRCKLLGLKNITVSDAVAYHYESVSRNKNEKKIENLQKDYKERLYSFYLENIKELSQYIK